MNVRILNPEHTILETEVDEIILPTSEGYVGILNRHCAMLCSLVHGVIRMRRNGTWDTIPSTKGLLEVQNNQVIVLLEE